MAAELEISGHLNEQQLIMLRLLKEPLSEKDFSEIRKLAVKILAKKMDENIEKWEKEKGVDENFYNDLSKQHFRSKP